MFLPLFTRGLDYYIRNSLVELFLAASFAAFLLSLYLNNCKGEARLTMIIKEGVFKDGI